MLDLNLKFFKIGVYSVNQSNKIPYFNILYFGFETVSVNIKKAIAGNHLKKQTQIVNIDRQSFIQIIGFLYYFRTTEMPKLSTIYLIRFIRSYLPARHFVSRHRWQSDYHQQCHWVNSAE